MLFLAAVSLTAATCNKSESATPAAPAAAPAPPAASPEHGGPPPAAGKNAALVLADVPGMNFSQLPAPAQKELATVFTDEFCYCGCPHTLGACLKQHTPCKHARRMATLAAAEAAAGVPGVEIIGGLSKYYQSFSEKRSSFKLDERTCTGPKDAKVTLAEYSDFECPYCGAARPMLEALVKEKAGVRLCYLPFPLSGHPNAMPAGRAALYARDHGKFWQMHDALFENQTRLNPQLIKELGKGIGLDPQGLQKAIEGTGYDEELKASKDAGVAAGVDSTPSLYVNGRKLTLMIDPSVLVHTVDDELEWQANKGAWAAD